MDLLIRNGASYHVLCKAGHQVNPGGEGRKWLEIDCERYETAYSSLSESLLLRGFQITGIDTSV
jgi:hypothetical protein